MFNTQRFYFGSLLVPFLALFTPKCYLLITPLIKITCLFGTMSTTFYSVFFARAITEIEPLQKSLSLRASLSSKEQRMSDCLPRVRRKHSQLTMLVNECKLFFTDHDEPIFKHKTNYSLLNTTKIVKILFS